MPRTVFRRRGIIAMELKSGQLIGNYRVVRQLGQGGMGTVYEVEHVGVDPFHSQRIGADRDGIGQICVLEVAEVIGNAIPAGRHTHLPEYADNGAGGRLAGEVVEEVIQRVLQRL